MLRSCVSLGVCIYDNFFFSFTSLSLSLSLHANTL